ncbi:hypothetical protein TWF730_003537 [Orbilia blumenaviensis]|uniref:F-box domain-containing protein n=1 Tax=Orbilia blumenaviensis TaxID=1796055 RepID=A0AAV9U6S9_9PEZI
MDPFLSLPAEICYSILSYLESDEKAAFSKCSRHCYFLAFPSRIRGVNVFDSHDRGYLDQFFDDGWLAPFASYIRFVRLQIKKFSELHSRLSKLAVFTNLTQLDIWVLPSDNVERNAYVALFSIISASPYYDNLEFLGVNWNAKRVSTFIIKSQASPPMEEQRQRYKRRVEQLSEADRRVLGSFIPPDDPVLSSIRLPKNLKMLKAMVNTNEVCSLWPLLKCETTPVLSLTSVRKPVMDHRTPGTICEFACVKTLYLCLYRGYDSGSIRHLPRQFPNLESLTIYSRIAGDANGSWLDTIPNLPKIKYLGLPVPKHNYLVASIGDLETCLENRLHQGHFPALRKVKFCMEVQEGDDAEITCTVFPTMGIHWKAWVFGWETIKQQPDDLRKPWSFGYRYGRSIASPSL